MKILIALQLLSACLFFQDETAPARQPEGGSLEQTVREEFELRQKAQLEEVRFLKQKLAQLEARIEAQETHKDAIVNSRVKELRQKNAAASRLKLAAAMQKAVIEVDSHPGLNEPPKPGDRVSVLKRTTYVSKGKKYERMEGLLKAVQVIAVWRRDSSDSLQLSLAVSKEQANRIEEAKQAGSSFLLISEHAEFIPSGPRASNAWNPRPAPTNPLLSTSKQPSRLPERAPGTIQPGDVLAIYIPSILGEAGSTPPVYTPADGGQPAIGFPIPVRQDGTISTPYIKPVAVKGLAVPEVETTLRNAYTGGERPILKEDATIMVARVQPGPQPVAPQSTTIAVTDGTTSRVMQLIETHATRGNSAVWARQADFLEKLLRPQVQSSAVVELSKAKLEMAVLELTEKQKANDKRQGLFTSSEIKKAEIQVAEMKARVQMAEEELKAAADALETLQQLRERRPTPTVSIAGQFAPAATSPSQPQIDNGPAGYLQRLSILEKELERATALARQGDMPAASVTNLKNQLELKRDEFMAKIEEAIQNASVAKRKASIVADRVSMKLVPEIEGMEVVTNSQVEASKLDQWIKARDMYEALRLSGPHPDLPQDGESFTIESGKHPQLKSFDGNISVDLNYGTESKASFVVKTRSREILIDAKNWEIGQKAEFPYRGRSYELELQSIQMKDDKIASIAVKVKDANQPEDH